MQIAKATLALILLATLITSCVSRSSVLSATSAANTATRKEVTTSETPDSDDFRVVSRDCLSEDVCILFVSVKKKLQGEDGLTKLSRLLSDKNPRKRRLNVFFYDRFSTAKSVAEGKIHPSELHLYAIGEYRYDEKVEYLKVRISKRKSTDSRGKPVGWQTVFASDRSL